MVVVYPAVRGVACCAASIGRWPAAVAAVAQLVERILGKDEVMGPIPISSFVKAEEFGSIEAVEARRFGRAWT